MQYLMNKSLTKQCLFAFSTSAFALCTLFSSMTTANTLTANMAQDLIESPLSISLNSAQQYRVGAQQHQVIVTQYGILNTATVNQINETLNHAHIFQQGEDNIALVQQYGSNNIITLSQHGNHNYAEIMQQGNDNVASITQLGEQTFKLQQIGNNLEVNVTVSQQ